MTEGLTTIYADFKYPVDIELKFSKSNIVFVQPNNNISASIDISKLTDIIPIDDGKFKIYLLFYTSKEIIIPCTNKELRDELLNKIFKFKNFIDYFYNKQIIVRNNVINNNDFPVILTLREIINVEVDMLTYYIKFYNTSGGFTKIVPTVSEIDNIWFNDITDNINPLRLEVYSKTRNLFYTEEDCEAIIRFVNEINSPYIQVL